MMNTIRIMRRSVFTFLQNFHYFTSTPSLLLVPFTLSTLVSQSLIYSSYLFPIVHSRLRSLFLVSGFPPTLKLFIILNLKLSQTILSFIFALPFSLSFLLIAKASIIRSLQLPKPTQKHALFSWIVVTQLCNSLVILSANATCLCLLVISFNLSHVLGLSSHPGYLLLLSATGTIVYSIILANAYIICNLSLIVSVIDKCCGFNSILKACVLVRGRTATALSLAVPINMVLASTEALFQYRIVRIYRPDSSMVFEAVLIAYLYAMLIVLDTIVGCVFLKSCKQDHQIEEIQERDDEYIGNVL